MKTLQGIFFGVVIGLVGWGLFGILLGVIIVAIAWAVASVRTVQGYMPYNGSVLADMWALAKACAVFFAPLGLFTGVVIGGRTGARGEPGFKSVLAATGEATGFGLVWLIPMMLLAGLSMMALSSELVGYSEEAPVTRVDVSGRPILYTVTVKTREGFAVERTVQDSSAEPRVREGETLRVFHKGDVSSGRVLLPGQGEPRTELSGKAMFLIGSAIFSVVVFGGMWVYFYLKMHPG